MSIAMGEELERTSVSLQTSSDALIGVRRNADIPVIAVGPGTDLDDKPAKLPKLPSDRYRYTVWHELRGNEVKGDELRNPRVRRGPEFKDEIFRSIKDELGQQVHHGMTGTARKEYEWKTGNWENCLAVNLSYQQLADRYQLDNFTRILKRLLRAEKINLMCNDLEDLSKLAFPTCRILNLNGNFFTSFTKLPKCPNVTILLLSDNSIQNLDGLKYLQKCCLKVLDLRRNPICFQPHYRQRVFQILPDLEELDGIPRLTSDVVSDAAHQGSCAIS